MNRRQLAHSDEAGVVLVLTMLVVSIFLLIGCAFAYSAGVQRRAARNARRELMRDCAVASALSYARALIEADAAEDDVDTLDDDWARDDLTVDVGGIVCTLRIEDEERRLNLNRALLAPEEPEKEPDLRPALKALLRAAGGGDRDFEALADAIDPDHPLPILSGLRAVPGLAPALFESSPTKPALGDLLATHPRSVNINTASEAVLEALWGPTGPVGAVLDRRASEPFRSSGEIRRFLDSSGAPEHVRRTAALFDVESDFFRVRIAPTGTAPGGGLDALIRRTGDGADVLWVQPANEENGT